MKEIKSAKTKDEREKKNRNNTKLKKYTKKLITPHSLVDDMILVNEYRAGSGIVKKIKDNTLLFKIKLHEILHEFADLSILSE